MKVFKVFSLICAAVFLCGCVARGEKDSISFVSSMANFGYDCVIEEIASGEVLTESCYVSGCKISLHSGANGKLCKVMLTSSAKSKNEFPELAKACVMSSCGMGEADAAQLLGSLGIFKTVPESTLGVVQTERSQFLFSFTADKAGAALAIRNLRLDPTEEPTVTMRSPEKASP